MENLKMLDLKKELQKRGLPIYGRKSVLIKRLQEMDSPIKMQNNKCVQKQTADQVSNNKGRKINKPKKNITCLKLLEKIRLLETRMHMLEVRMTKLMKKSKTSASKCSTNGGKIKNIDNPTINNINHSNLIDQNIINTTKSGIKPSENPIKKSKILILADGNGRNCVDIINNISDCKEKYEVSTFFKPNALFDEVVTSAKDLCKDLDKWDYVIVLSGVLNAVRGHTIDIGEVYNFLEELQNTNIIILSTTYCKNRKILNGLMYEINLKYMKAAQKYVHVNYVDTNLLLNNSKIVNLRTDLHYKSKKHIFENIYTNIINNQFINNYNLIEVEPQCKLEEVKNMVISVEGMVTDEHEILVNNEEEISTEEEKTEVVPKPPEIKQSNRKMEETIKVAIESVSVIEVNKKSGSEKNNTNTKIQNNETEKNFRIDRLVSVIK